MLLVSHHLSFTYLPTLTNNPEYSDFQNFRFWFFNKKNCYFFVVVAKAKLSLFYHVPRFESSCIACIELQHDQAPICIRFFVQIYRILPVTLPLHMWMPVKGTDYLFSKAYRPRNSFKKLNVGRYAFIVISKHTKLIFNNCCSFWDYNNKKKK